MNKHKIYITKKPRVYRKYTEQAKTTKMTRWKHKKSHQPTFGGHPLQKKTTKEATSSPKYNLFQLHNYKQEIIFYLCTAAIPFLKAIQFLSSNQKQCQIFFLFFPTKGPFQLVIASFTALGKTQ